RLSLAAARGESSRARVQRADEVRRHAAGEEGESVRRTVYSAIPALTSAETLALVTLSRDIHAHPELAYQERHAAQSIAALLERHGHTVERGIGELETALRARVGPKGDLAVALLAEYDALPDVGHGCGHNLIAISNIGAFLVAAVQAARLEVGVEIIGTPAEARAAGR